MRIRLRHTQTPSRGSQEALGYWARLSAGDALLRYLEIWQLPVFCLKWSVGDRNFHDALTLDLERASLAERGLDFQD